MMGTSGGLTVHVVSFTLPDGRNTLDASPRNDTLWTIHFTSDLFRLTHIAADLVTW